MGFVEQFFLFIVCGIVPAIALLDFLGLFETGSDDDPEPHKALSSSSALDGMLTANGFTLSTRLLGDELVSATREHVTLSVRKDRILMAWGDENMLDSGRRWAMHRDLVSVRAEHKPEQAPDEEYRITGSIARAVLVMRGEPLLMLSGLIAKMLWVGELRLRMSDSRIEIPLTLEQRQRLFADPSMVMGVVEGMCHLADSTAFALRERASGLEWGDDVEQQVLAEQARDDGLWAMARQALRALLVLHPDSVAARMFVEDASSGDLPENSWQRGEVAGVVLEPGQRARVMASFTSEVEFVRHRLRAMARSQDSLLKPLARDLFEHHDVEILIDALHGDAPVRGFYRFLSDEFAPHPEKAMVALLDTGRASMDDAQFARAWTNGRRGVFPAELREPIERAWRHWTPAERRATLPAFAADHRELVRHARALFEPFDEHDDEVFALIDTLDDLVAKARVAQIVGDHGDQRHVARLVRLEGYVASPSHNPTLSREAQKLVRQAIEQIAARLGPDVMGALSLSEQNASDGGLTLAGEQGGLTVHERENS